MCLSLSDKYMSAIKARGKRTQIGCQKNHNNINDKNMKEHMSAVFLASYKMLIKRGDSCTIGMTTC